MFWRRAKAPDIYPLTDDIAIAPQPHDRDWPEIREMGFHGVIDLRDEAADAGDLVRSHQLQYLRAPIAEGAAASVDELYEVTGWATGLILCGEPVLVYCREGRGRSAMVAVACLIRLGLPISEANSILMRSRPNAALSKTQMQALDAFASSFQPKKAA